MPRRGYDNYELSASAAKTATFTTNAREIPQSKGVMFLAATAVSGTNPTLDVVVQSVDQDGNAYDIAVFDRLVATGTQRLVFDPLLDQLIQCVCTITGSSTPTFTFSIRFDTKEN